MHDLKNILIQDLRIAVTGCGIPIDELSLLTGVPSQLLADFVAGHDELESAALIRVVSAMEKIVVTASKIVAVLKHQFMDEHHLGHWHTPTDAALRTSVLEILIARRDGAQETPIGVREIHRLLIQQGFSAKISDLRVTLEELIAYPPLIAKVRRTSHGLYLLL